MENASKALLMAGGVLIAIIIISLLVKMYGSIGAFQKQKFTQEEIAQIEAFNQKYIKYLDQYVYGTEVITIINQSVDDNQKDKSNIEVEIDFTLDDYTYTKKYWKNGIYKEETKTIKKGSSLSLKEGETYSFINSDNNENITQLKTRAFKCDKIEYDNKTGKVNYIHFDEKAYIAT